MHRRALVALGLLLALGVQGCARSSLSCTLIGGSNGVTVTIPDSLFVRSGRVHMQVCDADGCASMIQELGRIPGDAGGRSAVASFDTLGRDFSPGKVTVAVRLYGPAGGLVASRHQDVELTRSYPNGKACDGDGFVHGSVKLRAGDRTSKASPLT